MTEIEASTASDDAEALPFEVVDVTDQVARFSSRDETLNFGAGFLSALGQNVDLFGPGDSLSITVWENVDNGLLVGMGQKQTSLQETQIDQSGYIFVPYAGRIRAAGRSPEELRRIITQGLQSQTPDPQVEVRRVRSDSATVKILGSVNAPGVYPIDASTQELVGMLSKAGGISLDPEVAIVKLRRGSQSGQIWLQDLYDNPAFDVPLQADDSLIIERDRRTFTALGAFGTQQRVQFPARNISALEALGLVGGLNSQLANPQGVFVFRTELPDIANKVMPGKSFSEPVNTAYVIDLTKPGGMFTAGSFGIRSGDVLYVTEAPLVRVIKTLSSLSPLVSFAGTVNNLSR
ncbi:polysaccharide export protein [Paroceanicella profunda]|uniref:Polysaccharide export protein n=1 Tax=Paroceanicella profunda TaxID=2579971 RepID=A0A5B8FZJ6_9RHOB|nr:polysaccharide biosynthesis/export family protein [Paroceanicella profunda]QDL92209.1 polysaccharide export protein [Paroceanicella profunda]